MSRNARNAYRFGLLGGPDSRGGRQLQVEPPLALAGWARWKAQPRPW